MVGQKPFVFRPMVIGAPLSHGPQCVRPAAPNTPNPSSFPDAYSYPNSRTFRFHESAANQERVWQEEFPRKFAGQLPRTSGGAYPEIQSRFALSCSRPTSSAVCGRFFRLTYFSRYLTHSHVHRVSAVVFSYSRQTFAPKLSRPNNAGEHATRAVDRKGVRNKLSAFNRK